MARRIELESIEDVRYSKETESDRFSDMQKAQLQEDTTDLLADLVAHREFQTLVKPGLTDVTIRVSDAGVLVGRKGEDLTTLLTQPSQDQSFNEIVERILQIAQRSWEERTPPTPSLSKRSITPLHIDTSAEPPAPLTQPFSPAPSTQPSIPAPWSPAPSTEPSPRIEVGTDTTSLPETRDAEVQAGSETVEETGVQTEDREVIETGSDPIVADTTSIGCGSSPIETREQGTGSPVATAEQGCGTPRPEHHDIELDPILPETHEIAVGPDEQELREEAEQKEAEERAVFMASVEIGLDEAFARFTEIQSKLTPLFNILTHVLDHQNKEEMEYLLNEFISIRHDVESLPETFSERLLPGIDWAIEALRASLTTLQSAITVQAISQERSLEIIPVHQDEREEETHEIPLRSFHRIETPPAAETRVTSPAKPADRWISLTEAEFLERWERIANQLSDQVPEHLRLSNNQLRRLSIEEMQVFANEIADLARRHGAGQYPTRILVTRSCMESYTIDLTKPKAIADRPRTLPVPRPLALLPPTHSVAVRRAFLPLNDVISNFSVVPMPPPSRVRSLAKRRATLPVSMAIESLFLPKPPIVPAPQPVIVPRHDFSEARRWAREGREEFLRRAERATDQRIHIPMGIRTLPRFTSRALRRLGKRK